MKINPGKSESSLSDELSNPGTTPARALSESYTKNDQARFLIKAFNDFILPIVHSQESGLDTANRKKNATDNIDREGLGPAAQQLVDALENFINSLISPKGSRKDGGQSEVSDILENSESVPSVEPVVDRTQPGSLVCRIKAPEQPRLLKLALEEARQRIFNKMPIRLLAFKSDGSGIKLLDRSATWDYASTLIEAGFDEDQMNKDIQFWNLRVHNPEKTAVEYYISPYTTYAILSHTWLHDKPGEVTYADWKSGNVDTNSPGYQKLANFCRIAATDHGRTLAWMDTICINKDSSAELDESIRSMFKWYRDASVCITYLAQTTTLADMDKDAWFTRGWTLQELLAPWYTKFYGADWTRLKLNSTNDKRDSLVQAKILEATTITSTELTSMSAHVSRKMQWAANRRVTREEDAAYSLMGIFDVSFSIAYGEGAERAFFRLVQQILNSKGAGLDIINWGYGPGLTHAIDSTRLSALIPSGSQQYLWRAAKVFTWPVPSIPVTLTHLGLHLSVLLMPAISDDYHPFHSIGDYYSTVTLDAVPVGLGLKFFSPGQRYNVLASRHNTYNTAASPQHITFGVLNFSTNESLVSFRTIAGLRMTCFAVALYFDIFNFPSIADAVAAKAVEVIPTRTAITFDLLSPQFMGPLPTWFSIPKQDLAQHGMQLLNMYL